MFLQHLQSSLSVSRKILFNFNFEFSISSIFLFWVFKCFWYQRFGMFLQQAEREELNSEDVMHLHRLASYRRSKFDHKEANLLKSRVWVTNEQIWLFHIIPFLSFNLQKINHKFSSIFWYFFNLKPFFNTLILASTVKNFTLKF